MQVRVVTHTHTQTHGHTCTHIAIHVHTQPYMHTHLKFPASKHQCIDPVTRHVDTYTHIAIYAYIPEAPYEQASMHRSSEAPCRYSHTQRKLQKKRFNMRFLGTNMSMSMYVYTYVDTQSICHTQRKFAKKRFNMRSLGTNINMFMHVCVYACVCIYTWTYVCVYTWAHIRYSHIPRHGREHVYVEMCVCLCIYTHIPTYSHTPNK
jgi:hypothetical protein